MARIDALLPHHEDQQAMAAIYSKHVTVARTKISIKVLSM